MISLNVRLAQTENNIYVLPLSSRFGQWTFKRLVDSAHGHSTLGCFSPMLVISAETIDVSAPLSPFSQTSDIRLASSLNAHTLVAGHSIFAPRGSHGLGIWLVR